MMPCIATQQQLPSLLFLHTPIVSQASKIYSQDTCRDLADQALTGSVRQQASLLAVKHAI